MSENTQSNVETEPNQAVAAQQPETPTEPFLTVSRRGQNVALSREQAVTLAAQGLDYTQKTQAIAREREAIKPLLELREQAERNPTLQRALQAAASDPERVLRALSNGHAKDELDPSMSQTNGAEVEQLLESRLQTRLAPIEQELQRTSRERATTAREQAIERAIKTHEVLSDSKAGQKAVTALTRQVLTENPDLSVDEAVGEAVMLHVESLKERGQALLDRSTRQAPLKTQPANVGTPPTDPPRRQHNQEDLRRGRVSERISREIKQPGFLDQLLGKRR